MNHQTLQQNKSGIITMPYSMAQAIFEELRLLRKEVSLVLPQDDLENYSHPEKIRSSYEKAIKDYPPAAYGNY